MHAASQLLTKVLLPALALSFFSKYSAEIISEYAIVFAAATAHVLIGILLGHVAALVCRVKSPFAQVMALTCAVPHPAIPLVMMPAILINWSVARDDPSAESKGMSTIGIYLTIILLLFATVVNADIATMAPRGAKPKVLAAKPPLPKRILAMVKGIDHTLYCCVGAIIIGVIPPVKEIFMPGGAMSWLSGTIKATGSLSPAMSVYIIGGLIFNVKMAKLGAKKAKGGAATKAKAAAKGSGAAAPVIPETPSSPTGSALEEGEDLPQLTAEQIADYKEAFTMFDADGGGEIDVTELDAVMKSLGLELTEAQVKEMVAQVDADGGGSIDFDEFCKLMARQQKEGGAASGMALAIKNVQAELASMEGEGGNKGNRAELLRQRWERQRLAAKLWTAAFSEDDSVKALGGDKQLTSAPKVKPPSMNLFIGVSCLMKLVVMPGVCIALNQLLYQAGAIPDNKMMRLILNIYPCIPTAAALVARFSAGGYDDAARYCATTMLPMYLLSIPTIAGYIVLSVVLIGD